MDIDNLTIKNLKGYVSKYFSQRKDLRRKNQILVNTFYFTDFDDSLTDYLMPSKDYDYPDGFPMTRSLMWLHKILNDVGLDRFFPLTSRMKIELGIN